MSYKIENIISDKGFILKLLCYTDATLDEVDSEILTPEEKNAYHNFKSVKRKLEYFFTRVLWKDFGINEPIFYDQFGRPFLKKAHISISHSRDIIVIAYNEDHQVGVDVEYLSQKISMIKHKFISQADENLIDLKNETQLTLVWSIKEAVYKMENIQGLSLKENIHVNIKNDLGYVNVKKNGEIHTYTFQFIVRHQYVITYCSFGDLNSKISDLITSSEN